MEKEKIKKRNNLIDIFRLYCAILVIIIHTVGEGNGVGFIIYQVFTGIAVPFFFAVAGFFYINSLKKEKKFLENI